ncbi:HAMP domain-containing methyl-accepting chemotaxis protein [Oceanisphaera pacifica]|uniref:HAMP domain-containing protein n=1 Tax=Oceanisphaera pacifica TaxID=2818389 RepID=A0ABS3NC34_9GAMM|nr:methyl-accepting chemotaxis protein [Oceanisphaera pacifica]MBO1518141.1 HAMP domain-containing protein [Oceanisphaera pacifica]
MLSKLGHLSVRAKLTLGFALVLVATLITAVVSFYALSSVLERSDKLERAGEIDLLVSKARFFQKNYMLNNDPQQLEQARAHVDEAREAAQEFQTLLTKAKDQAMTQEILTGTQIYDTELENMVKLNDSFYKTLDDLNVLGSSIQQRLERFSRREDQAFNWVQQFVKVRLDQKDYALSRKLDLADDITSRLTRLIKTLEGRLALQSNVDIRSILSEIKQYQQHQALVVEIIDNLETTDKHITKQAVGIAGTSEALLEIQQNHMKKDSAQANFIIALVTLIGLAMGILFAIMITRGVVNPLGLLVTQANRIAEGDLSQDITHNRKDELGKLMDQMQIMTLSLRQLVGDLRQSSTLIATSAEELSSVSEQSRNGVNQQRMELEQVSTAMNEMAATVQEVARHAETAFDSARTADSEANDGNQKVTLTIGQIGKLSDDIQESLQSINQLEAESLNIGGILDVIKGVAEQTNLLALNAAIEAARAGEQGRGFAVVADEVRTLAQRTQEATSEIETLITNLQSKAQQSVVMMNESTTMASETVVIANEAGESIHAIASSVSDIQQMNSQIATAAEEQSTVAEDINRSVFTIRESAEHSSAATEQTAAASAELARQGSELQRLVSRFQLP